MTLTLELSPTLEAQLREKAQRRGMAVDAYLLDIVARDESGALPDALEEIAVLYERSLATGGELTAATDAPGDLHEYSTDELAAMEAGEFDCPIEQPLRKAA